MALILGGNGDDTLRGTADDDRIEGGDGRDYLLGGGGVDLMIGGDGDDVLIVERGNTATLTGGSGRDTFAARLLLFPPDGVGVSARITDFSLTEDRFQLSGLQFTSATVEAGGTMLLVAGGAPASPLVRFFVENTSALSLAQWNALVATPPRWVSGTPTRAPLDSDLVFQFNGAVARGQGAITLRTADGTLVEAFDVATSGRIAISGNRVTIDPTLPLAPATRYRLEATLGTLTLDGFAFGLVTDGASTPFAFETLAAPAGAATAAVALGGGVASTVGGTVLVFGERGTTQDVTVRDLPGLVTLDPSFNAGGDRVRLAGPAADYVASLTGSSVRLSDGDTIVEIPVGTATTDIVFGDGVRGLRYDAAGGRVLLGGQPVSAGAAVVAAPAGPASTAGATSPLGEAVFALQPAGTALVADTAYVFGNRGGGDVVRIATGARVTLDPSFNAGGDTIDLPGAIGDYSALRDGSTVRFLSSTTQVSVPIGIARITLRFDDAVTTLSFNDVRGRAELVGFDRLDVIGTTATALAPVQQRDIAVSGPSASELPLSLLVSDADYRLVHAGESVTDSVVRGFSRGDTLLLSGEQARYAFASNDGALRITYTRSDGALVTTVIEGIADPAIFVDSEASAVAAVGFDFVTFTI